MLGKPRTTCIAEDVGLHLISISDCPCTAHDARVAWPTGPDGYRQPENTTGIDILDLNMNNYDDTAIPFGDSWVISHGPINKQSPFMWSRGEASNKFLSQFTEDAAIFQAVIDTDRPNYQGARIPLKHGLHMDMWRRELKFFVS